MVHVRYFAGARAAAGRSEESVDAPTLDDLLKIIADRGERMPAVLAASSFLVNGLAVHDRSAALEPGCTVDVLPPFAGG
ncbi:MAG TPA: MoaD/ThiS family protein [Micromonosporaceae bacterium]|jgi:molybdopterin converting factor small subunit